MFNSIARALGLSPTRKPAHAGSTLAAGDAAAAAPGYALGVEPKPSGSETGYADAFAGFDQAAALRTQVTAGDHDDPDAEPAFDSDDAVATAVLDDAYDDPALTADAEGDATDDDRGEFAPGPRAGSRRAAAALDRVSHDNDADRAPAPRNKQELLEDLQRNYREVVALVRKVDAHLDVQNERAERMLAVAERVDAVLPSLEKLGNETSGRLDGIREEIVAAIQKAEQAGGQRAEQIENAIVRVGLEVEQAGKSQDKLVETMAQFRETINEITRANSVSAEALDRLSHSAEQRDRELVDQFAKTRTWVLGAIAVVGGVSLASIVLAAVVLAQML